MRSARGPITTAEIEASSVTGTALDLVSHLRPQWLRTRNHRPGDIRVYLDGVRVGDTTQSLRNIFIENVSRIERLDAAQATARYGTGSGGHSEGAIMVTSRR